VHPLIAEALIHASGGHRVLGHRLAPFSLWHELVLEQIESPFLRKNDAPLLPRDLISAVAVCRCVFPVAEVTLRTTPALLWRMAGGGYARELKAFLAYAGDYLVEPQYSRVQPPEMEARGGSGALYGQPPRPLAIAADIIGWTGWDRAAVLNLPSGEARLWQAFVRRHGGEMLDWATPEQESEFDKLAVTNPDLHAAATRAAEQFRARKHS
jgi:hypothetical protein